MSLALERGVAAAFILIAAVLPSARTAASAPTAAGECVADTTGNFTGSGASLWGSSACHPPAQSNTSGRDLYDLDSSGDAVPAPSQCEASEACQSGTAEPVPLIAAMPLTLVGTPGLKDVAQFLVGDPVVTVEPSAWTVVGLETNFIATAGEHEQSGRLLGQPVVVHFTPVSYDWRYGDGEGRTVAVPGSSWAASDLPAFAKTATSHAYAARGSYHASVTVRFTARYRFAGQGWVGIPGTLGLTSDPVVVTVKAVKMVLVGKTCLEKPSGPGCETK